MRTSLRRSLVPASSALAMATLLAACSSSSPSTTTTTTPGATTTTTAAARSTTTTAPASAAPSLASRAWTAEVQGAVYAQPVVSGKQVFVATEADEVYAPSLTTGHVEWHVRIGAPLTHVAHRAGCGDVDPLGITSTPVADAATGTLFVVGEVSRGGAPPVRRPVPRRRHPAGRPGPQAAGVEVGEPEQQPSPGRRVALGPRVPERASPGPRPGLRRRRAVGHGRPSGPFATPAYGRGMLVVATAHGTVEAFGR